MGRSPVQLAVPFTSGLLRSFRSLGFARAEVRGLAVAIGLGCALSWLCAQHPAALPVWMPWDFSWPEYFAAVLGVWWFLRGVSSATEQERPAVWQEMLFLAGVAAVYAVLQTRFDYMAQHEFFLNRIQHIVMHHLGPFLIALAWPGPALLRGMPAPFRSLVEARMLRRPIAMLQQPVVAVVLFVGLVCLFLIPQVHFRAMIDSRLYAVMNWSMVVDGLLFWCLVLDQRPKPPARVSYGTRMVLPLVAMFPQIALGAHIAFSQGDLYPYYAFCGRLFASITATTDQHIGGIIVWIPAAMMSAFGFLLVLNALRRHEDGIAPLGPEELRDGPQVVFDASAWTGR